MIQGCALVDQFSCRHLTVFGAPAALLDLVAFRPYLGGASWSRKIELNVEEKLASHRRERENFKDASAR